MMLIPRMDKRVTLFANCLAFSELSVILDNKELPEVIITRNIGIFGKHIEHLLAK